MTSSARPRRRVLTIAVLLSLAVAPMTMAAGAVGVPPVMRFGGVIAGARGETSIVFAIYRDQGDETPLWSETQTIDVDDGGRFAALLGNGTRDGLPVELFASGDGRWLGVRPQGQPEQARVMLVSVPYALKAASAETLGGKPVSAFVLADGSQAPAGGVASAIGASGLSSGAPGGAAQSVNGIPGYLGMFANATDVTNSAIFQNAGAIGVNTTTPQAAFHSVASATPGAFFDVYNPSLGALPVVFRAARGTPGSPSAVQTDDILGGLAVRGYATTGFTGGRGQVMFKAAEPWTDAANGTYLQMTTTPIGSAGTVERLRITSNGNVGIGTTAPQQRLSVNGIVESTSAGFKFPDGSVQITAAAATLGANTFTASQNISNGDLGLPMTTSATNGVITLGGTSFLHAAGTSNTFLGLSAGASVLASGGGFYNTGVGAEALASLTSATSKHGRWAVGTPRQHNRWQQRGGW